MVLILKIFKTNDFLFINRAVETRNFIVNRWDTEKANGTPRAICSFDISFLLISHMGKSKTMVESHAER